MSKVNKSCWKKLPIYEQLARKMKQNGSSDEEIAHIRQIGKEKELRDNENRI